MTVSYWDEAAGESLFTHPIDDDWVTRRCRRSHPLLDYGCGYGRTLRHLQDLGYHRLFGVDLSTRMIERAQREAPLAELHVIEDAATPFAPESFVMVLLIAVLTCVPDTEEQRRIVDEVTRLMAPGAYLYVSDYLLQTDEQRVARYRDFAAEGYAYGVFDIDDGQATMRHHDPAYFAGLMKDFDLVDQTSFELETMKGNPAVGTRFLLRKG